MKFLDLFAGVGGFRLGMEQAGHECIGFCEIDKFARKSYKAIHDTKGEIEWHDITTVTNDDVRQLGDRGHIDIICGGFPCQAFSVAGKRGGFDDTRGTLFFEIVRIANILRPRYLFLENVKGLLNHDKGNTFETILRAMDELGYDAEWQVLNSKNFGVPQNRERVFIVGHLRGTSGREVFPIGGENTNAISIAGYLEEGYKDVNYVLDTDGIAKCLTTMGGGNREPKILDDQGRTKKKNKLQDYAPTLRRESHGNDPKVVHPVLTPDRLEKRQNGRRFKDNDEPMFTLTSQDRHGIAIREVTKKGYAEAYPGDSVNYSLPNSKTRRGRVGEQIANTLDTGCQQGVVIDEKERNTFEILFKLQQEIGEKEVAEWRFRILDTLQSEKILRQEVHGGIVQEERENKQSELVCSTRESEKYQESGQMREMRFKEKCRYSPQGLGLEKQFAREFTSFMSELSHEGTQAEKIMHSLQETTQGIGVLRKALHQIQEIWKSDENQKQGVRIRKLTPKETWRLQGFPDWAFDKAAEVNSNSQLYKQAGNSVTVNVIYEIAKRFSE